MRWFARRVAADRRDDRGGGRQRCEIRCVTAQSRHLVPQEGFGGGLRHLLDDLRWRAPTRVGARAVVAAVGCTVRAGRRRRCRRRSSASSVRCRGPGNAADLVVQSRTGYVESGVITEVMVAVGSLACTPVRTRGAQTENHRSNRGIRWSTTSARSTGQMSQRSSALNGNVSPSLRNLTAPGLTVFDPDGGFGRAFIVQPGQLGDGIRHATVITHSTRKITVSECTIIHVVRTEFIEGSRPARQNHLCQNHLCRSHLCWSHLCWSHLCRNRLVKFVGVTKVHRCHRSTHIHVRALLGVPFGKSATDSSKRDRPDPCR